MSDDRLLLRCVKSANGITKGDLYIGFLIHNDGIYCIKENDNQDLSCCYSLEYFEVEPDEVLYKKDTKCSGVVDKNVIEKVSDFNLKILTKVSNHIQDDLDNLKQSNVGAYVGTSYVVELLSKYKTLVDLVLEGDK